jgi:hypothetical protein
VTRVSSHLKEAGRGQLAVMFILVLLALAVLACGYGAVALLVVSLVFGVVVGSRRLALPLTIAIVWIWTLAAIVGYAILIRPVVPFRGLIEPMDAVLSVIPLGVGYVLFVVSKHFECPGKRTSPLRGNPQLILGVLSGAIIVVFCSLLAVKRFGFTGIAWALGGDARNMLMIYSEHNAAVLAGGSLVGIASPHSAFLGLLDIAYSNPMAQIRWIEGSLEPLVLGLFLVTLLAIVMMCVSSACLMWQATGRTFRPSALAITGASVVPLAGVGIGVGLQDGFLTALLAISVVTFSIQLSICAQQYSNVRIIQILSLTTLAAAVLVLMFLWAYIAITVAVIFSVLLIRSIFKASITWRIAASSLTVVACFMLWPIVRPMGQYALTSERLLAFGSIAAPATILLFVAPLIVYSVVRVFSEIEGSGVQLRIFFPYFCATFCAISVVVFIAYFSPGPPVWPYYAAKISWIWIASTSALIFLPVALLDRVFSERKAAQNNLLQSDGVQRFLISCKIPIVVLVVLVLAMVQQVSPVSSPVLAFNPLPLSYSSPIADGWGSPSPLSLDGALTAATLGKPTVVWGIGGPGGDRLANFWLDLQEVNKRDDFRGWAYYETGTLDSLCDLLHRDESRTVVTRDPNLGSSIIEQCGITPSIELLQ